MIDWQIEPVGDGGHDLVIGADGDFVLIGETPETHQASVLQDLIYELGTWLGESALDRAAGFPWRESVFGIQPLEGIAALVYERIVGVDNIEDMSEGPILDFDLSAQRLSISGKVKGVAFEDSEFALEVVGS